MSQNLNENAVYSYFYSRDNLSAIAHPKDSYQLSVNRERTSRERTSRGRELGEKKPNDK
ncbi:hypothetical protein [Chroococcidiopsis sp.]|uniref:hypothetical protein n=1 Tax=Chroococcidiopsis sp. TaxID=3088168 RepID=UPI003F413334